MSNELVPLVADKHGNPIHVGDTVIVNLPGPWRDRVAYRGVVGYEKGTYQVVGLRDIEYGERFRDYEPENTVDLRDLREPLKREYVSNYGDVVSQWSENLVYLEVCTTCTDTKGRE